VSTKHLRKTRKPKSPFPPQHQRKPGIEKKLEPRPKYEAPQYRGSGKLAGRVALITGGDSGIGRAVAVLYAREGADVAIVYLKEEQVDAEETRDAVEREGRRCLLLPGDVTKSAFCEKAVERTINEFGQLDVLVNNAAFQQHQSSILDVTDEQFEKTFRTNIFGYFYMARATVPRMQPGSAIVNTGSITGLQGSKELLDYAATKGAGTRLHEIARAESRRAEDPSELCCAGSDLDSAQRRRQGCQKGWRTRQGHADAASRATRGSCAGLRVLRLERGLQLHHGRGTDVTWRRDDGGMIIAGKLPPEDFVRSVTS
jgi:NADP-dependent 3-hydroxy acid dehydrogenase YdfG